MNKTLFGAVELGGTKMNCMVAEGVDNIIAEVQLPTEDPEKTLAAVLDFFRPYLPLKAVGLGSFGPIDLDKSSDHYGAIQTTPKPNWTGAELYARFKEELGCEVHIDTDVNAAGLAEQRIGAAQNLETIAYTTVGTGIGTGVIVHGKPLHGLTHPEVGHIELSRVKGDEEHETPCPFHPSCAEGLASGTGVKARWGKALNEVESDHPAWDMEAEYLAKFAHNLMLSYSPQKLIFGGGVSTEPLLEKVKDKLFPMINAYVEAFPTRESLDGFIVLPQLRDKAGILGSLLLAIEAL